MPNKKEFAINLQYKPTNSDKTRQNATNLLQKTLQMSQEITVSNMKINVILDTRRAKANGTYPVRVRFYFQSKAVYVNTDVSVLPNHFVAGRVINVPKAMLMNNMITQKLMYVQTVLDELTVTGRLKTEFRSGAQIKAYLEQKDLLVPVPLDVDVVPQLSFEKLTKEYIDKCSSKASRDQYSFMLKKVRTFCDAKALLITDINVAWLKDFDAFCEQSGMNVNGRGFYLRPIRTLFNDAIDRELIGAECYPFRRFKIKKAETEHRNMPIKDLVRLILYDCEDSELAQLYRDLFLLSFYLCGINLNDLLLLKKTELRGGYIQTNRNKTNVPMLLKVEPEAQAIIDRYRGQKLLLWPMERYANYGDFRRRMNEKLKTMIPYITIYWARHTWATLASELDVSDAVIDMALGHKLQGMSAVYIKRNVSKVAAANRKVIDYVNKKKPIK